MKKAIMVCGIARGGTSLTCGLLNAMGVDFHQTAFNDVHVKYNPKGHFETYEIFDLNRKPNSEFSPLINGGEYPSQNRVSDWENHLRNDFMKLVDRFSQGHDYWGYKIGSIFSVEVFANLLKGNVHLVCVTRSVVNNAMSYQNLVRSHGGNKEFPYFQSLKEISNSTNNLMRVLEKCSLNHPVSFTTFEDIRKNPIKECDRLAVEIGMSIGDEERRKVLEFVEPDLILWEREGNNAVMKAKR